eukprot:171443-Prymnesium_polylepis.1
MGSGIIRGSGTIRGSGIMHGPGVGRGRGHVAAEKKKKKKKKKVMHGYGFEPSEEELNPLDVMLPEKLAPSEDSVI